MNTIILDKLDKIDKIYKIDSIPFEHNVTGLGEDVASREYIDSREEVASRETTRSIARV